MNKVNLSIQGKFVIQSLNLSIHTHNAKLQLGRPIEEAFMFYYSGSIVVIQSLGQVQLLATPWTAACQASLPFIISWSLLKHIHWVRDAIQPSHSLLLPSPAFSLFHHQGLLQDPHFVSGGQSTGASVSASVLPVNIQSWYPLGLNDLISLLSKGLSRIFSSTSLKALILGLSVFFRVQLSHLYMTTGKTIALTIQTFVYKMISAF